MRDALTLKEVAALLPIDGPGADLIAMADTLRARAGYVQQCLFRLIELGAARVVWDDPVVGAGWWRIDGVAIPDVTVRPGTAPKKPDDVAGNVGVHDGIEAKKIDQPLILYGEDAGRPRVPLTHIRTVAKVKAERAKSYATVGFIRAEDEAKGDADKTLGVLAVEADALSDAAEMVRARIKRLNKEAAAKRPASIVEATPTAGPP
jgi:hypothetical protein